MIGNQAIICHNNVGEGVWLIGLFKYHRLEN